VCVCVCVCVCVRAVFVVIVSVIVCEIVSRVLCVACRPSVRVCACACVANTSLSLSLSLSLSCLFFFVKAVVKLQDTAADSAASASLLTEYSVRVASETDKFLVLYALLRLGVIENNNDGGGGGHRHGKKTLFFVATTERAYRLKLFLERFSLRSALLNDELPLNSRLHALEQFNRGLFDYLIATDVASRSTARTATHTAHTQRKLENRRREVKKALQKRSVSHAESTFTTWIRSLISTFLRMANRTYTEVCVCVCVCVCE